jgi:hypothetical protein
MSKNKRGYLVKIEHLNGTTDKEKTCTISWIMRILTLKSERFTVVNLRLLQTVIKYITK